MFPDTCAYGALSDGDDVVELSDDDRISLLIYPPHRPIALRCTMCYSLRDRKTQTVLKSPVKNNSFKLKLEKKEAVLFYPYCTTMEFMSCLCSFGQVLQKKSK